jgi:hypothetical protein
VRNGSISGFGQPVDLGTANGSIVEGLRVSAGGSRGQGIRVAGIVKGNIVTGVRFTAIAAIGTVTGNYVTTSATGISVGQGRTVIGNTATDNSIGINVACPSNVTGNTAINSGSFNLVLNGDGCNNTNNVAP